MAVTVCRPLDLRATLRVHRHGANDPCCRVTATDAWLAARTPVGPGTLHLWRAGDRVEVEAWGEGADWLIAQTPALLGEHDHGVVPDGPDAVVARAAHLHPGLRIGRSGLVVQALVPTVLAQRITAGEALRQWAQLCRRLSSPAPGPPGLLLPPAADALAEQPSWWYHRLGIERRRADTLRRIGRHADRLEEAATMPLAAAYQRLRAVPGIGVWTAASVAGPALGDADAVPVGDYHLPSVVTWTLAGEPRGTDERMLELLEPYAGERGRVVRLLLAEGKSPPAFGPRRRLLPVARW